MNTDRFHCCASCEHFRSMRREGAIEYWCSRLGYETKPDYKFDCWNPKEQVKRLMEKEQMNTNNNEEDDDVCP